MQKNSNEPLSAIRPMGPRDIDEPHRAATPLELLFDLVSVIAIAAAAAGLHHAAAEAHLVSGIIKFMLAFFAIWWAWMNYTWFASAYDNDDAIFRILTMVTMAGSLTMAAGIEPFFRNNDLALIVIGFVVMRGAMAILWWRASRHHPEIRSTTQTYAIGIALVQLYWVGLMLSQPLGEYLLYSLFVAGAILELAVPILAERRGTTPWHRHHMIERYGLLNIIVLGETLLAASWAIGHAKSDPIDIDMVRLAVSALVILFSMWWLYFSREDHLQERRLSTAIIWGYGHLLIYMAGAAVGAGLALMVDIVSQHAETEAVVARDIIGISVAVYLLGLWIVRDRYLFDGFAQKVLPFFALALAVAAHWISLEAVAVIALACVIVRTRLACRAVPYEHV